MTSLENHNIVPLVMFSVLIQSNQTIFQLKQKSKVNYLVSFSTLFRPTFREGNMNFEIILRMSFSA